MDFLIVLLAPIIGLMVGLLPGVGGTLIMLLLYPFLSNFDITAIILFYAIMINARDFSGSVSAINFGILGELNSAPALMERSIILKNQKQLNALKNTMYGSFFGMAFATIFLFLSVISSTNYVFLLRTDVSGFFLLVMSFFLIYWRANKYYVNIVLIIIGFALGSIGYDYTRAREILTFDNSYLAGGIPFLPFVFGIYVVPKLIEVLNLKKPTQIRLGTQSTEHNLKIPMLIRNSFIGSLCGLIPYIGSTISSNLAHSIEQKFSNGKNVKDALSRVSAAETANNAAQTTVLIPLLILGLAIQPSELMLLDILENKGWQVQPGINWQLLISLVIALPIGGIFCGIFCYQLIRKLLNVFCKYFYFILYSFLALLIIDIIWIGYKADQIFYYFLVFISSYIISFLFFKKTDTLPLLIIFLLQDTLDGIILRLPLLYSS